MEFEENATRLTRIQPNLFLRRIGDVIVHVDRAADALFVGFADARARVSLPDELNGALAEIEWGQDALAYVSAFLQNPMTKKSILHIMVVFRRPKISLHGCASISKAIQIFLEASHIGKTSQHRLPN